MSIRPEAGWNGLREVTRIVRVTLETLEQRACPGVGTGRRAERPGGADRMPAPWAFPVCGSQHGVSGDSVADHLPDCRDVAGLPCAAVWSPVALQLDG